MNRLLPVYLVEEERNVTVLWSFKFVGMTRSTRWNNKRRKQSRHQQSNREIKDKISKLFNAEKTTALSQSDSFRTKQKIIAPRDHCRQLLKKKNKIFNVEDIKIVEEYKRWNLSHQYPTKTAVKRLQFERNDVNPIKKHSYFFFDKTQTTNGSENQQSSGS